MQVHRIWVLPADNSFIEIYHLKPEAWNKIYSNNCSLCLGRYQGLVQEFRLALSHSRVRVTDHQWPLAT